MEIERLRRTGALLLPFCMALSLHAGEWELGAFFADGQKAKGSITSNGNFGTVPYTSVQNTLNGPWTQGGVQVGYELFHRGNWGVWVQASYSSGLAQPEVNHTGANYAVGSTQTENFLGTATYKSHVLGLGLTRKVSFGEFGLVAGPRSHSLSAEGNLLSQVNGVFTNSHYAVSHAYQDTFVSMSFTAIQDRGGFRSFQKIAYGTGFGSSVPAVNPGPGDWKMSEAYLAQGRPNQEVRITLGVRL
jgi:hypothetical protein